MGNIVLSPRSQKFVISKCCLELGVLTGTPSLELKVSVKNSKSLEFHLKLQVQDDTRRSQISENVGSVYIVLFISQSFFLCSHLSFLFHLFSVCHSFLFSFSVWFFFHSNDYCLNFSLSNSLSYIIFLFISVFLLTPIPWWVWQKWLYTFSSSCIWYYFKIYFPEKPENFGNCYHDYWFYKKNMFCLYKCTYQAQISNF